MGENHGQGGSSGLGMQMCSLQHFCYRVQGAGGSTVAVEPMCEAKVLTEKPLRWSVECRLALSD